MSRPGPKGESAHEAHVREGDFREFRVVTAGGTRFTTWGERDARLLAGKDGTYEATGRLIDEEFGRASEDIDQLDREIKRMRDDLARIKRDLLEG